MIVNVRWPLTRIIYRISSMEAIVTEKETKLICSIEPDTIVRSDP